MELVDLKSTLIYSQYISYYRYLLVFLTNILAIMFSIDKQPSEIALLLAQKVRVLRKDKGYSQKELAERCGVSLASIKRFEQSGQISLESLLKIAHLLGKLNDFESILNPPDISKDTLNKLFKS